MAEVYDIIRQQADGSLKQFKVTMDGDFYEIDLGTVSPANPNRRARQFFGLAQNTQTEQITITAKVVLKDAEGNMIKVLEPKDYISPSYGAFVSMLAPVIGKSIISGLAKQLPEFNLYPLFDENGAIIP